MAKVAIFGAGQIGRAVYKIITDLKKSYKTYQAIDWAFVVDSNEKNINKLEHGDHALVDINSWSVEKICTELKAQSVSHVINSMPFFLNEKIALAAHAAGCHYIDFTEDDKMADRVQQIYQGSGLTCAVKCGLAPGFINYIGHSLVSDLDSVESLMISVGALPRDVSYNDASLENSYNLSWSVDGLVNEYIRPCRVRKDGKLQEVMPLNDIIKVVIDGFEYEAAPTSGGVGSLVHELEQVSDVSYMTLRYPGHYKFVKDVIEKNSGDFDKIKQVFLEKFPYTDRDVIVVYANAVGKKDGVKFRKSYSNKFYGVGNLSAIQSTTAGAGVAILEMILNKSISGIVNHKDIKLSSFEETLAFLEFYKNKF